MAVERTAEDLEAYGHQAEVAKELIASLDQSYRSMGGITPQVLQQACHAWSVAIGEEVNTTSLYTTHLFGARGGLVEVMAGKSEIDERAWAAFMLGILMAYAETYAFDLLEVAYESLRLGLETTVSNQVRLDKDPQVIL